MTEEDIYEMVEEVFGVKTLEELNIFLADEDDLDIGIFTKGAKNGRKDTLFSRIVL